MHRRHLGDAVAVVFVGGAQRHVPARNVGDGDMPRRRGGRYRKDLEPVAQQKHRVGAAGGEMIVEHRQRAGDGAGRRLAGVVRKDGKPRRDGHRCAPVTTSCKVSARLAASFWTTGRSRPYSARVAVTTVTMGGIIILSAPNGEIISFILHHEMYDTQ